MDKRLFEPVRAGVCAIFLIIYSCMQILQKLWYSAAGDNLTGYFIAFAVPVLMLSGGIYLTVQYKKKPAARSDDENRSVSAAVGFISGCAVMAMVLINVVPSYLLGLVYGQFDAAIFLFPLAFNGPFLIAAAVAIKRGSLKHQQATSSARIAYLCLRTVLMLVCVASVYRVLTWLGPFILFTSEEINFALILWILSESVFAAAALILLFSPLRLKMELKNSDGQSYEALLRQTYTLTGYMLLIVGIPEICDVVIRKYEFFDIFFFQLNDFLAQFVPALLLVLVSLLFIHIGKKTERVES